MKTIRNHPLPSVSDIYCEEELASQVFTLQHRCRYLLKTVGLVLVLCNLKTNFFPVEETSLAKSKGGITCMPYVYEKTAILTSIIRYVQRVTLLSVSLSIYNLYGLSGKIVVLMPQDSSAYRYLISSLNSKIMSVITQT